MKKTKYIIEPGSVQLNERRKLLTTEEEKHIAELKGERSIERDNYKPYSTNQFNRGDLYTILGMLWLILWLLWLNSPKLFTP